MIDIDPIDIVERLRLTTLTINRWHDAETDQGERAILKVIVRRLQEASEEIIRLRNGYKMKP